MGWDQPIHVGWARPIWVKFGPKKGARLALFGLVNSGGGNWRRRGGGGGIRERGKWLHVVHGGVVWWRWGNLVVAPGIAAKKWWREKETFAASEGEGEITGLLGGFSSSLGNTKGYASPLSSSVFPFCFLFCSLSHALLFFSFFLFFSLCLFLFFLSFCSLKRLPLPPPGEGVFIRGKGSESYLTPVQS